MDDPTSAAVSSELQATSLRAPASAPPSLALEQGSTSVSGQPDEPEPAGGWLDAADADADGRWVDASDSAAVDAWGASEPERLRPEFNPRCAYLAAVAASASDDARPPTMPSGPPSAAADDPASADRSGFIAAERARPPPEGPTSASGGAATPAAADAGGERSEGAAPNQAHRPASSNSTGSRARGGVSVLDGVAGGAARAGPSGAEPVFDGRSAEAEGGGAREDSAGAAAQAGTDEAYASAADMESAGSDGEPRASAPGSALEDTLRSPRKAPIAGTGLIQEVQGEAGARLAPLITSGDGGGRALSLTLLDPVAEGKGGAAVRLVAYGDEDGDSRSSEDAAGAGAGRNEEEEEEDDGVNGEGRDGGEGGGLEGLVGFGSRAPGGSWDAAGGGGSTSSGGYGSSDEADPDFSLRFCTNCTAPLDGVVCMDCGHDPADDAALFDCGAAGALLPVGAPVGDAADVQPTVLVFDERMEAHEEGRGSPHPERPDRIRAVVARLLSSGLAGRCRRMPCREASTEELASCHRRDLMAAVSALSARVADEAAAAAAAVAAGTSNGGGGGGHGLAAYDGAGGTTDMPGAVRRVGPAYLTPDTYVNARTDSCARLAAGACIDVAVAVARGEASGGAAIVRPPGHHAESGMAMGFCFFCNAALAARAAQAAGAQRVLILDWDVHHGNGTQHIFEHDPSVLYMSIHRYDGGHFYPGTGAAGEVGAGAGEGFTVNVPWPCGGMGNGDYLAAFSHVILPIAYEFAPDLIVVSAGFDAAAGDPIGGCRLAPEAFGHLAALLGAVAPLAVLLEGGYNLAATAAGCEATLAVLLGRRPARLPAPAAPSTIAPLVLQEVVRVQSRYWRCLRGLAQRPAPEPALPPGGLALKRPATGPPDERYPSPKRRLSGSPTRRAHSFSYSGDLDGHLNLGPSPSRGPGFGPGYGHEAREKVVGGRLAGGVYLGPGAEGAAPRPDGGANGVLRLGGGSGAAAYPEASAAAAAAAAARPMSPRRPSGGSPHAVARAFSGALSRSRHLAPRQQRVHSLHLLALRALLERKRQRQRPTAAPPAAAPADGARDAA